MKIVKLHRPLLADRMQYTLIRKGMFCVALVGLTALGACGQKGPLVMPASQTIATHSTIK